VIESQEMDADSREQARDRRTYIRQLERELSRFERKNSPLPIGEQSTGIDIYDPMLIEEILTSAGKEDGNPEEQDDLLEKLKEVSPNKLALTIFIRILE
jgi:hypothetical protein